MSFKIILHKQPRIAEVTLDGEISMDELLSAYREVIKHPDYQPGFSFLTDYRKAFPMYSIQDMDSLVDKARYLKTPYKSAVVMADTLDAEYALVWCQFSYKIEMEDFLTFTDYEDAWDWLTQ